MKSPGATRPSVGDSLPYADQVNLATATGRILVTWEGPPDWRMRAGRRAQEVGLRSLG